MREICKGAGSHSSFFAISIVSNTWGSSELKLCKEPIVSILHCQKRKKKMENSLDETKCCLFASN